LVVALDDVAALIPVAALVVVMIFVAIATVDWNSIKLSTVLMMPNSEPPLYLSTIVLTVWTHSLAIGVGLGVLTAIVLFANRVAHLVTVERRVEEHFGV
jgi:SulP family sulfate permease